MALVGVGVCKPARSRAGMKSGPHEPASPGGRCAVGHAAPHVPVGRDPGVCNIGSHTPSTWPGNTGQGTRWVFWKQPNPWEANVPPQERGGLVPSAAHHGGGVQRCHTTC